MDMKKRFVYMMLGGLLSLNAVAQPIVIDRVIGVIGDFNILQSDIEQEYLQLKASGQRLDPSIRCDIYNEFIQRKLLMNQAKIDSVEVGSDMVELSMEQRLDYFISQFGSEQEMEDYFGRSIFDIKDDLREAITEQMVTDQVRRTIIEDVTTTPSDVKNFYRSMDPDSIP